MECLPIDVNVVECDFDGNVLPIIVNVFSLRDISVFLDTTHVNNLQTTDQCSSPLDPIPALQKIVNKIDTSAAKSTPPSRAADKKFACPHCWRKFPYKNLLEHHIRTHTGEKPFSCHLCDYASTQQQNLNRHMRRHTGEKPFSCDVCGKKFRQKNQVKEHKSVHTGERPYSCVVCGMSFVTKGRLKRHHLKHTHIKKSHKCELCDKMFTWKGDLAKHIKDTHKSEG